MMLRNICYDDYENVTLESDDEKYDSNDWNFVRQYLWDVSQPCSEMLLMCRFALETFDCLEVFDTVLTDEGINITPLLKCDFSVGFIFISKLMKAFYIFTQNAFRFLMEFFPWQVFAAHSI